MDIYCVGPKTVWMIAIATALTVLTIIAAIAHFFALREISLASVEIDNALRAIDRLSSSRASRRANSLSLSQEETYK